MVLGVLEVAVVVGVLEVAVVVGVQRLQWS